MPSYVVCITNFQEVEIISEHENEKDAMKFAYFTNYATLRGIIEKYEYEKGMLAEEDEEDIFIEDIEDFLIMNKNDEHRIKIIVMEKNDFKMLFGKQPIVWEDVNT